MLRDIREHDPKKHASGYDAVIVRKRSCSNRSREPDLAKFVQRICEMDDAPREYRIESASGVLLHRRGMLEASSISRVPTFLRSISGATYAGPGELPSDDVLRRRYHRKRSAGVKEDVLETCMGKGGIIRVRCERMRVISELSGSVGALAGSSAGTTGYSGLVRISIIRDSKAREVVASWIHQARFGGLWSRFAQEIGKCLFVTRYDASIVHCASQYRECPIDNRPNLLTLIRYRSLRPKISRSVSAAERT